MADGGTLPIDELKSLPSHHSGEKLRDIINLSIVLSESDAGLSIPECGQMFYSFFLKGACRNDTRIFPSCPVVPTL